MRVPGRLAIVAVTTLLSACVPSLHPLYEGADVVLEPELAGVWQEIDGSMTWSFAQDRVQSYSLVIHQAGTRDRFEAHLVRLDGNLFLDLFPEQEDLDGTYRKPPKAEQESRLFTLHTVPVHTFWRIRLEGGMIQISAIDHSWLAAAIDSGTVTIGHGRTDDRVPERTDLVLTAPTVDLQRFVVRYADKGAFDESDRLTMRRVP